MCVRAVHSTKPGQQVRFGICHAGVGSAPLTSLSSLDKDRHNLPSSLCSPLHTHLPPSLPPPLPPSVLPLHHLPPASVCLAESLCFATTVVFIRFCIRTSTVHSPPRSPLPEIWLVHSAASCARRLDTARLSYLAWQVKAAWELEWEVAGGGNGDCVYGGEGRCWKEMRRQPAIR